jgi:conserved oligomeric Golgi complex subunit 6
MSSPLSPPAIAHSLSARSDGWNAQSRNPISSRLYKVLGTTYNDEGTKEALRTLSDFYCSNKAPISSVSSKKTSTNAWEDELEGEDDDDVLDLLKQVPSEHVATTAPGEIAARARKNMRRDVERKLAEGSRKFLDAFGDVDQVCVHFICDNHTRTLKCQV